MPFLCDYAHAWNGQLHTTGLLCLKLKENKTCNLTMPYLFMPDLLDLGVVHAATAILNVFSAVLDF